MNFPRSDYRPAWLYWSARARDASGDRAGAIERYQLTVGDYQNTYYGPLGRGAAEKVRRSAPSGHARLFGAAGANTPSGATAVSADRAGDSHAAGAGSLRSGAEGAGVRARKLGRLAGFRPPPRGHRSRWRPPKRAPRSSPSRAASITLMKRAYPQFLARGGEQLPREILMTIFPLSYWDLIRKYSAQNDLDPYLVAALMAQESTFVRDIRSHANAYGLTQLMPPTAQAVRAQAQASSTRTSLLTNPGRQHPNRHGVFGRHDPRVRLGARWRWPATTPAKRRCAAGCRRSPRTCRRTSSSTTSRIRKPRTT